MPKVNFFEIPFDDAERVTKFYSKVFGWEIKKNTSAGFDYYFIHTEDDDGDDETLLASSYSGGMIKKRTHRPSCDICRCSFRRGVFQEGR